MSVGRRMTSCFCSHFHAVQTWVRFSKRRLLASKTSRRGYSWKQFSLTVQMLWQEKGLKKSWLFTDVSEIPHVPRNWRRFLCFIRDIENDIQQHRRDVHMISRSKSQLPVETRRRTRTQNWTFNIISAATSSLKMKSELLMQACKNGTWKSAS